ncbi:MAG: hypothetical protein JRG76_07945, partial [Deltaproteobacteria bacterium]|nr:hypothetical protein [Deltaproteobacteria bacterium]
MRFPLPRIARPALAALLAALLPLAAVAQTAAPEGTAATEPAPPVEKPEPSLAEVVGDAGAAEAQLRQLETDLTPDAATQELAALIPEAVSQIEERAETAKQRIEQATQMRQLEDMESRWLAEQARVEGWRSQTTGRALAISESLARVAELTGVWEKTREQAKELGAPATVLERIGSTLQAAQITRDKITDMRAQTLESQAAIGGVLGVVADVLERSKRAKQAIRGGLLGTDSLPIWAAIAAREDLGDILDRAVAERRA